MCLFTEDCVLQVPTKVKSALDDGHSGINDLGTALEDACSLQTCQQVLQQLAKKLSLVPAAQDRKPLVKIPSYACAHHHAEDESCGGLSIKK